MKLKKFFIAISAACIGFAFIQKEVKKDIIQPGAKLEKLADGFLFTEGPTSDANGNVYFTDQPNNRILVWSVTGKLSTFMQPCGRSNGLSFDSEGNLWACADEKNELWCIATDKSIKIIPSKFQDERLNGPNDLWINRNGGIYFTDPYYQRSWWNHTSMPQNYQAVYYLNPDHKTMIRVINDLVQPNGIVGTPDGKTLFVADIRGNKTWSYTINKDGNLSNKTLFCEMGSDGMTIDVKGNIYLTGKGVTIFDKNGKQIGHIDVPENWTANVCFGGNDMKSLFITASKGLYRIRMKVKGMVSCQNWNKGTCSKKINVPISSEYRKGEYGYDLEFLKKYLKPLELVNSDSRLVIEPEYQGRVMTSSSMGLKGFSYGWINYDLIASSVMRDHINPYGGEEKIWLGPEGGQYSIFFKKGKPFNLANWFVPSVFDHEPFEVENTDGKHIILVKKVKLENYSGTIFNAEIRRKVSLLNRDKINEYLGIKVDSSIHVVAYQSENRLKNIGNNCWNKEGGALSIWMLSELNSSPEVTVVLPFKKGDWGKIVKDDYFGKVPENRLKVSENAVFFLADGKFRSKIGISPQRTVPMIGSYDAKNNILTLIEFSLPEKNFEYVNSALEIQEKPFSGDAINSYNDGPTDNGSQQGSFYELEVSSPAAFLEPGEDIMHIQRTYHLQGSENALNVFAKSLLNVSIGDIKKALKK